MLPGHPLGSLGTLLVYYPLDVGFVQTAVGLEGGSRGHSTVRQPDSQGSQTVVLVAPCMHAALI